MLLLFSWGEDYSDLLLQYAPNLPQLIQIISHLGFVMISSLVDSPLFHNPYVPVPTGNWKSHLVFIYFPEIFLKIQPLAFLHLWKMVILLYLSLRSWAILGCPRNQYQVKKQATNRYIFQGPLQSTQLCPGHESFPHVVGTHGFAHTGGACISLTLRRIYNFIKQERWRNFRLLPESSFVSLLPLHSGFCLSTVLLLQLGALHFLEVLLWTGTAACATSQYLHRATARKEKPGETCLHLFCTFSLGRVLCCLFPH